MPLHGSPQALQLLLMTVLIRQSLKAVGKNVTDFGAVSVCLINWGQQLGLMLQVSRQPDVNSSLGVLGTFVSLFNFQAQAEWQVWRGGQGPGWCRG